MKSQNRNFLSNELSEIIFHLYWEFGSEQNPIENTFKLPGVSNAIFPVLAKTVILNTGFVPSPSGS